MAGTTPPTPRRLRLRLWGLVQGVGFRPHIYGLAHHYGLHGFVYNDKEGLVVEAEGEEEVLQRFMEELQTHPPPLARIDGIQVEAPEGLAGEGAGFAIRPSPTEEAPPLWSVGPDMAPCPACMQELLTPPGAEESRGALSGELSGVLERHPTPLGETPHPTGEAPTTTRRYLYPFLNCTHCGPRYSLSLRMPWDRPNTTLAEFAMCAACRAEYKNPRDRRFHAQPIACPACGPQLQIYIAGPEGEEGPRGGEDTPPAWERPPPYLGKTPHLLGKDTPPTWEKHPPCLGNTPHLPGEYTPPGAEAPPLALCVACIAGGGILALKAAGGFQLACDAHNEAAVRRLRTRKMRDGKPLAVMVPTLATAHRYAMLSEAEAAALQSPERPIVLLRAREGNGLAPALAPGLSHLGLCLPSTPLHYALFYEAVGGEGAAWLEEAHRLAWLMTSANLSGEPLVAGNAQALCKLRGIADVFALHNRRIATRMDDSVLQVVGGAVQLLRRARGFVPRPLPLPWRGPPLLAVGAQQKSTFCLLHNNRAYVSQHLGELDNPEARASFCENVQHLCTQLQVRPALLAADMHPEYFSTQWAEETGLPCLQVQHHVAHLAAVWAEYPGIEGPLVGLALDGSGLGMDGLSWGGELLYLERRGGRGHQEGAGRGAHWERLGHLSPLLLLGGDMAARHPWRMGVALHLALGNEAKALAVGAPHGLTPSLLRAWKRQTLHSTSLGRQWDAAAHLLGLCEAATYEAEAPMLLEALAHGARGQARPWPLEGYAVEADNTLNLLGVLGQLEGRPVGGAALWLHEVTAKALGEWAIAGARRRGATQVLLGGGCLQNRLLCEALVGHIQRGGLQPLLPKQLPPNDGGLCMGQALLGSWHFG